MMQGDRSERVFTAVDVPTLFMDSSTNLKRKQRLVGDEYFDILFGCVSAVYHSCFVYFCVCTVVLVYILYQHTKVNCLPYGANIILLALSILDIRPRPSICVIWKIVVTCPLSYMPSFYMPLV